MFESSPWSTSDVPSSLTKREIKKNLLTLVLSVCNFFIFFWIFIVMLDCFVLNILIVFGFFIDLFNDISPVFVDYIFFIFLSFVNLIVLGFFRVVSYVFCDVFTFFFSSCFIFIQIFCLVLSFFLNIFISRLFIIIFFCAIFVVLIVRHRSCTLNWVDKNVTPLDFSDHVHELTKLISRDATIVVCVGD